MPPLSAIPLEVGGQGLGLQDKSTVCAFSETPRDRRHRIPEHLETATKAGTKALDGLHCGTGEYPTDREGEADL